MIKNEYINKIKDVEGITSKNMLPEWNDKQNKLVDKEIKKLFIMKRLVNHRNENYTMYSMESIENFFGLAYTSSSSFAMLGACNTRYCLDVEEQFNVDCFGLGTDNKVYIFTTDKEENEKVYQII